MKNNYLIKFIFIIFIQAPIFKFIYINFNFKNIRVNNEFYVCPVFNEAIESGLKIKTFDVNKMWGLGTPEDLKYFLENYEA